jgi:hypothetical protein
LSIHNKAYRECVLRFQGLRLQQIVVDFYRQSSPYQFVPCSADPVDGSKSGVGVFVAGSLGEYKGSFWPQAVSMTTAKETKPIFFNFILFAITTSPLIYRL